MGSRIGLLGEGAGSLGSWLVRGLGDLDRMIDQRTFLARGLGLFLHGLIIDGLVKALENELGGVFNVGVRTSLESELLGL